MGDLAHQLEEWKRTLDRYVQHRVAPGDFLTAVLRNDLRYAVVYAGREHEVLLGEIVRFVLQEMPGPAHGSAEKVTRWLDGREER